MLLSVIRFASICRLIILLTVILLSRLTMDWRLYVMVQGFLSTLLRYIKLMIHTLKLVLVKVLPRKVIIILLLLLLIWWLNPPQQANGADLDMLVDTLVNQGLKIEVYKEMLPADDGLSEYSLYDIDLLSDVMPAIVNQYGVGTTNLDIFDRIAAKLPLGVDYVYFRDSQYLYSIVFGDLSYSGTSFSGTGCTRIDYYTYTGSNQQPTYTISKVNNFSLNVGNYLVYSNLGNYPMLGGAQGAYRYTILSQVFCLLFTVFFVFWGFARLRKR